VDGGRPHAAQDDEPEAIRHRLAVFERETAPVLDWYRPDGARVVRIDADAPCRT
jgi:adenylate kinase family enzyme